MCKMCGFLSGISNNETLTFLSSSNKYLKICVSNGDNHIGHDNNNCTNQFWNFELVTTLFGTNIPSECVEATEACPKIDILAADAHTEMKSLQTFNQKETIQ